MTHTLTALLGQRIAALRKAKFSSGQSFADALTEAGWSTSRATIADIESGRRRFITVDELVIIADVLDVTIMDLFAPSWEAKTVQTGDRTWRPTGRDRARWRNITRGKTGQLVTAEDEPGKWTVRYEEI